MLAAGCKLPPHLRDITGNSQRDSGIVQKVLAAVSALRPSEDIGAAVAPVSEKRVATKLQLVPL